MEKLQLAGDMVFLLRDFLTPEEGDRFIARSEETGYEEAPITTSAGFEMRKSVRSNDRVIVDDDELAREWFDRSDPHLPVIWFGWELVGFNERFRYYRYDLRQHFALHTDGYFQRANGERSQFTFMDYLNDDFEGGTTNFYSTDPILKVEPEKGTALVFAHKMIHEGAPVTRGRKYVLRTDVMYRLT